MASGALHVPVAASTRSPGSARRSPICCKAGKATPNRSANARPIRRGRTAITAAGTKNRRSIKCRSLLGETYDLHPASIEAANRHAEELQITNVQFSIAAAKDFPGSDYGFVTVFDALHDMGDPVSAASHVKQALQPDGTFMIVEPLAGDSLAENINPVGRVYYGFSTMICTPGSLSQEVGLALGAQAGERRLREVLSKGGFTRFRRAAETPFNMILEARP
jgi:SAM-dependent methyltransferase